jgi:hypothetical protein
MHRSGLYPLANSQLYLRLRKALPKESEIYCREMPCVEGEDADRVACFKSEMRQVDENWLTQFQADDGSFIQDSFPSFGGLDFLLVCLPKELGLEVG